MKQILALAVCLAAAGAAQADESLIPDYAHITSAPEDATARGYIPSRCDFQLLIDNILDLTHADYVHAGFLGSGALTRSKAQVTDLGERSVRIAWLSSGDLAPAAFDMHLREQGRPTDQWTEVTWIAPGSMRRSRSPPLSRLTSRRVAPISGRAHRMDTPRRKSAIAVWNAIPV